MKPVPFLNIAWIILVTSCAAPPDLTHTSCPPPPEPQCNPGVSHAQGIDTANLQPGRFKYHIDLLPEPVNTNKNDNAITFIPSSLTAIVSAERANESGQRLFKSEMLADLHFNGTSIIRGDSFENIGAANYCAADKRLYFTAKANNDDPNDYDLYSAILINNPSELGDVHPLSVLNKANCFDAQPALSKDGLMIVYASDRGGGHGGVDLWFSTRKSLSSDWEEPKVMPSAINTPCDELSPSFSADGKTLYFSSNGHETIGGYDIFSSEYKDGSWTEAQNIGAPINTKSDEIFPYQLSDSQFFYTSDQPAKFRGRNIFVLRRTYIPPKEITEKIPEKKVTEKNIPDSVRIVGKVELSIKIDTLPEVFVRDVDKNKEIARKQTDTAGGYSFTVEKGRLYDVGSDQKDKFYDMHRIDLRHPTDSIVVVPPLTVPDTLVLRINFPFDDATHPYDFIIDENGKKSEMRWQTSIDLIAKSIKNSPSTLQSVILTGHTDSLGTDDYNYDLSKRRGDFVAKQLEERGIPAKLLVIFPKGRTMPVKRDPGESDDTFYLRCRRVEFVKFFSKDKTR